MLSPRSTLAISVLALAGSLVTQLASADLLPNAWQITDNSAASLLNYTTNLPNGLGIAATNVGGGFRFKVNARFVGDFGGAKTMGMGYGLGSDRFFIWWQLNGNGDLTAELEGTTTLPLTTNGTGTALYHTHEMVYNPANQKCTYLFDGQVMNTNWVKSSNNLTAGQVYWGAGSSPGLAQMNFNRATFEVTNTVVADYYAGTQGGNPATAPNPTNQSWTLTGASANGSGLSPDTALLPVATTLAQLREDLMSNSARLNGEANAHGSPTTAWFEWGTSTNYGNVTTNLNIGNGLSTNDLSFVIGGLSGGPTYNYRLVASNAFGVVSGANQSFNLSFLDATPVGTNPGIDSFAVWGDFDNDEDLDFLFVTTGGFTPPTSLIRNDPQGLTPLTSPSLNQVQTGCAAWGDYDNDGRLDFLLTGTTNGGTSGAISQLWRNTSIGSGTSFSNVTASMAPGLPGVVRSSVAWGDYDNDGRLDFLLTGLSETGRISQLWRNLGTGFSNVTASVAPDLPGVNFSSVAWGDYDNDGRVDFLLTGNTNGGGRTAQLWRNTGSGFSNVTASVAADLPGVSQSSVAWGDYDNDGRLDFLLTGSSDTSPSGVSQLWRNTGSGFTNVTASVAPGLPGVYFSSVAWGDYDNDGRLDFLLTGLSTAGRVSQLWRNLGTGFSNVTASVVPSLPGSRSGSVAWGDYDHDGRLDILITGDGITSSPGIWKNNLPISNAPPVAPSGLSATLVGTNVTLSWNASTDDHTPADGLNYSVRIGTTPGGSDVVSPQALTNGSRLLPQIGNAGPGLVAFYNLPPGRTYYWSVQAVDTGFAGSPFAVEQQFTIAPRISNPAILPTGQFQFFFTNLGSAIYEVLATTNVALQVTQWSVLGLPTSVGGGGYQFTNAVAPSEPRRFYLLRKQ